MSPSSLGNLSKPGELLHYLQPPFSSCYIYKEPSTNNNGASSLCSQTSPWKASVVFPSRGSALHFSPCPSTFVTHMALLLLPVEGTQAQSAGHFCSSSDWEVSSAGEVELVQFRPPHSQNTTLNRRQEQEVPEAIASIQVQATRISHLEHYKLVSLSPLPHLLTHVPQAALHQQPKRSFKSIEGIKSVLTLKPLPRLPHSVEIKSKLLNLVY